MARPPDPRPVLLPLIQPSDPSSARIRSLRKLGAAFIVASGDELREAGGADVIIVTGSSYEAATSALRGLRPNGRMVLATIDARGSFVIDPSVPFFSQNYRIIGATHNGLPYLAEALDFAASGAVTPMIETFPKEQIATAGGRVADGDVRFPAVVPF